MHSDGHLVKRKALRKRWKKEVGVEKKINKQVKGNKNNNDDNNNNKNILKNHDNRKIFNFCLKVLIAQSTCITLHKVFHSLVPKCLIVLCVLLVAAN